MRLPAMAGVIERRILANYRIDPAVAQKHLPEPFRVQVHHGYAIAGICLIRLGGVRPSFLPGPCGFASENAAHRFAVEWPGGHGVYIPRRDSDSRLNAIVGGRLFPGRHSHARFDVAESERQLSVSLASDDGQTRVHVAGTVADRLPAGSAFTSLEQASAFFHAGSVGYSATSDQKNFDGLELACEQWAVTPLAVASIASSFFDDPEMFPPGSIHFDCALLMRNVPHTWHTRQPLCCQMT